MSRDERGSVVRAFLAPTRHVKIQAQAFNREEQPIGLPLELAEDGGEVVVDTSSGGESPTHTAHLNLSDPFHKLPVDGAHAIDGKTWWAKFVGVEWSIWVGELERWVTFDIFRGNPVSIERQGPLVLLDCQGKEGQHLGEYVFPKPFTIREHTRLHLAIRRIFTERGESRFHLNRYQRRLKKDRNWPIGASPWLAAQKIASELAGKQLFYQGNGQLRLRNLPKNPCWDFTEGKDSITLEATQSFSLSGVVQVMILKAKKKYKELVKTVTKLSEKEDSGDGLIHVASNKHFEDGRKVVVGAGNKRDPHGIQSFTGTAINLNGTLRFDHPKGAVVRVEHRVDRERPIVARAELKASHPLSAKALTDNKRPIVRVTELAHAKNKKVLKNQAENRLDNMRIGIEQDIGFTSFPVVMLEPMDKVKISVDGVTNVVTLKRFIIPLSLDGLMDFNWFGEKTPPKRNRGKR